MDPLLTLAFVGFLYLILLIGLVQYYRRFRYAFLMYGALALVVQLGVQVLNVVGAGSTPLLVGTGLAGMIYLGFIVASIADITDREFPRLWFGGMALLFAGVSVFVYLTDFGHVLVAACLAIPASAVLMLAAYTLVRFRNAGSIGEPWFAGILAMELVLSWTSIYFNEHPALLQHIGWMEALVALLAGVALIMITSERAFNDLLHRDERLEEIQEEQRSLELQFSHAQKLESLGALAGGIAHDFNNMLTSILGYTSLAMKKLPNDSEIRKDLYMVMSGARQAVDLTSQMLIYAGKGALEFEPVDLSRVVDNMSSLIHSSIPRKIQLNQKLGHDLPSVKGDRVQLGQVLMNLVANAVDAIEDNTGTIEIATGLADVDNELLGRSLFGEDRAPGTYLYLRVSDTGIGMQEDQIERIFDPFYSEKQTSKGLGLSSLSGIVRQHNGFIRVRSNPGAGTEFAIYFPIFSYQETGSDGKYMVRHDDRIRGDVLIAEDDARIRGLMVSILEGEYFRLTSAEDGQAALRAFEERGKEFDLLVLDCTMPKMSGPEVYWKVREGGSTVPIVLVSGYHQDHVITNINEDPNARFIKKPFNVDDFVGLINSALQKSPEVE